LIGQRRGLIAETSERTSLLVVPARKEKERRSKSENEAE